MWQTNKENLAEVGFESTISGSVSLYIYRYYLIIFNYQNMMLKNVGNVTKCQFCNWKIIQNFVLYFIFYSDCPVDWSDHAIWWPERNMWLKRTGTTLDQYGVQADARLWFTPMHKTLRVQMPDMQLIDMRVDFSENIFKSVMELGKELGKLSLGEVPRAYKRYNKLEYSKYILLEPWKLMFIDNFVCIMFLKLKLFGKYIFKGIYKYIE